MLIFLSLFCLLANPTHIPTRKTLVTVEVQNIRKAVGYIQIGLFRPCDGFPEKCHPAQSKQVLAVRGSIKAVFEVDPGDYALAVFHDINDNGKIDTRFFIPREPYGFSNNVRPRFSTPKFADCRIHIDQEAKTIPVWVD